MTAVTSEQVSLPPRPLIRTFWSLHRAIVRLTGGRLGLQTPESGARFGMLRLQTVGRRTGRERITMIGYFEDGSNLVSLAMNGWGKADPAWWLNLQANPVASVQLPTGRRDVRARVASGAERERLWAAFRDYPGWGSDVAALAALRHGETAVVVLEPNAGPSMASESANLDSAESAVGSKERTGRRLRRRHLWLVPGLAIAFYANMLGGANGLGILPMIAFGLAPDLPRLLGSRGRVIHSLLHNPVPAAASVALAATGIVPVAWLVGSTVWLGHVVVGWAVGDVPRKGVVPSHA